MEAHQFQSSEHASLYSNFRPKPPKVLIDRIAGLVKSKKALLDVGCGSGQGTLPMISHFEEVYGTDISEAQIAEARRNLEESGLHCDLRVAPAYPMLFLENSFDAVTGSQCVHWFVLDKFYDECRRVLRKDGILAMYGYTMPIPFVAGRGEANRKAETLIRHYEEIVTGPYWDIDRTLIVECYVNLPAPQSGFVLADRATDIVDVGKTTLKNYLSYLQSHSPYQKMIRLKAPHEDDAAEELQRKLLDVLDVSPETEILLKTNFFMVAYRKTE